MNDNKPTTPLKAIKAKCLDCCCDQLAEVKLCPVTDCPLFPFRNGKNPFVPKRELSEEQKEHMRQLLELARAKKN